MPEDVAEKATKHGNQVRSFISLSNPKWGPLLRLPAYHPVVLDKMTYAASLHTCLHHNIKVEASALVSHCYTCRPTTSAFNYMDMTERVEEPFILFQSEAADTTGHVFAKGISKVRKLSGQVFNVKRAEMKQRHPKISDDKFPFTKPKNLNLANDEIIFFSDFTQTNPFTVEALVSKERGMTKHSYWTGSGDHVNSQMQVDLYRQFGMAICFKIGLWPPNAQLAVVAVKNVSYEHFIEFGSVFQLQYVRHAVHPATSFKTFDETESGMPSNEWKLTTDKFVYVEAAMSQFGKPCSTIQMWLVQTNGKGQSSRRSKL